MKLHKNKVLIHKTNTKIIYSFYKMGKLIGTKHSSLNTRRWDWVDAWIEGPIFYKTPQL